MKVVLIRHAQKDFLPIEDPILNEKGLKQAEKLRELVKKNLLPIPTNLWCSDRIRTRETLDKIASEFNIKPEIHTELNLRETFESRNDFRQRLNQLVSELSDTSEDGSKKIIYLCTHFDVIEELMSIIPSDADLMTGPFTSWAPAQYIVFELSNQLWHVLKTGSASDV